MKKLICIAFLSLCVFGCKKEQRTDYVINGKAKGLYNGIRVYLNTMDERGRITAIDTAIVMNETFTLDGTVEYPSLHYITVNGVNGRLPVIIENAVLELNINQEKFSNSKLKGSKENDIYSEFGFKVSELRKKLVDAKKKYNQSFILNDTLNLSNDKQFLENLEKEFNDFPYAHIEKNKEKYSSLTILSAQLNSRNLDTEKFISTYNNLDENIKTTSEGRKIGEIINSIKEKLKSEKSTTIGAIAPEFSAPNPEGKIVALSDVVSKGKITIIDFWAAWCGPCRRENPNVVKVYNKYHDKGLEIIGVGLDGRRGQQNPKEAWIKAIKDDNLTWHQVSNLKYFDQIARRYNVGSIPSMFVLDNEGKIVAKNLRGLALENKIAELLN
ncbi:TlpA disulfide reductase family protein [Winogradskyella haliclonae]|uniref:Thiol:disulfide interchange protein n=1 Tax=Winogradskyella haliclonae TaxID=2048558 RepID=A0ABQ2BZA4_9FLAO|nr:TlpA disulfide reductase family protein [Winogradskyella haliclonae]GGI57611.1 thiol:disulfide interchange protein [Winogradskyella haliclonae]